MRTDPQGSPGLDDYFARNIGAEIMGSAPRGCGDMWPAPVREVPTPPSTSLRWPGFRAAEFIGGEGRSEKRSRIPSIPSSFGSRSGSGDSFPVLVRWTVTPRRVSRPRVASRPSPAVDFPQVGEKLAQRSPGESWPTLAGRVVALNDGVLAVRLEQAGTISRLPRAPGRASLISLSRWMTFLMVSSSACTSWAITGTRSRRPRPAASSPADSAPTTCGSDARSAEGVCSTDGARSYAPPGLWRVLCPAGHKSRGLVVRQHLDLRAPKHAGPPTLPRGATRPSADRVGDWSRPYPSRRFYSSPPACDAPGNRASNSHP